MAGIDFGNQTSAVALIRKGSIDVVANEASSRLTPSLVGFGTKERFAGESAQTQYTTNVKNTVSQIKRFIGRKFSQVQDEIRRVPFNVKELPNDEIGIEVNYNGSNVVFTPVKILAILFVQLKKIAEANLNGGRIPDVVISVPTYFSDSQRKAVLHASEIAGLNCVRLMNETTATALIHGFYKLDLPEENPNHVLFIDTGHSATTASVVAFTKGKLRVVSTAFDANLGGRDVDQLLVDRFAADFKNRYKIDVLTNSKALLRLRVACERLKQVLSSGVPEAPLNIECLMEDKDVSARLTKKDFEEMIAPIVKRMVDVVQQALSESGLTSEQLYGVEIVGACKRIPAIQVAFKELLKRDLGQTLNDVESVAKGCALQAAIVSPIFKVREFQVVDWQPFPIEISWNTSEMQDLNSNPNASNVLFPRGSFVPSTKKITLKQSEPLEFVASYGELPQHPTLSFSRIGVFRISTPQSSSVASPENTRVESKFRLTPSGVFGLESAELLETYEETEQPQPPKEGEQPAEAQASVKRKVRRHAVQVDTISPGLSRAEIAAALEEELNMQSADKLAQETAEARNNLESYILGMRGRIAGELFEYGIDSEREQFNSLSYKFEDWLYEDEGRNAKKSEFVEKLRELEKLGNQILLRKKQEDLRAQNCLELQRVLAHYRTILNDAKYDHIDAQEKAKISAECDQVESKVRQMLQQQQGVPKNANPAFNADEIINKKKELEKFANAILSKPKPKPPQPEANQNKPNPEASAPPTTEDVPMKDANEPSQGEPMQDENFTEVD